MTIALQSLAADIRSERGCVGCSVMTNSGHGGVVRYVEEWRTEDDLRRRVQSDPFMHLVTLMEDASQPPRIEFVLKRAKRGLDFVEELRRPGA